MLCKLLRGLSLNVGEELLPIGVTESGRGKHPECMYKFPDLSRYMGTLRQTSGV